MCRKVTNPKGFKIYPFTLQTCPHHFLNWQNLSPALEMGILLILISILIPIDTLIVATKINSVRIYHSPLH